MKRHNPDLLRRTASSIRFVDPAVLQHLHVASEPARYAPPGDAVPLSRRGAQAGCGERNVHSSFQCTGNLIAGVFVYYNFLSSQSPAKLEVISTVASIIVRLYRFEMLA